MMSKTYIASLMCILAFQGILLGYFGHIQNVQDGLIRELSWKLSERGESAQTGRLIPEPSESELALCQPTANGGVITATLSGDQGLSADDIQNIIHQEFALLKKEFKETSELTNVPERSEQVSEEELQMQLSAESHIDEVYNEVMSQGEWRQEDFLKFQQYASQLSDEKRRQTLDKLMTAINDGLITTDGSPLF
jgi:hypothetical protein